MPEIISTPNALVQTNNGKRFYVNSGVISVTTDETTMISINDIGERDIMIGILLGCGADNASNVTVKVKNNGTIIYDNDYANASSNYVYGFNPLNFIIPANTSLEITLESVSASLEWTVSAYGKYLSM